MDDNRNEGRKQWAKRHPDVAATPSMKRRMAGHNYHDRGIYMITLCVEKRIPRLGALCGPDCCHSQPWVSLSSLGKRVEAEWLGIPRYYPQIKVLALTVMPDHLHGILFVTDSLPVHLGKVINGFKAGCNRAAREMGQPVPLWETGYTDGILGAKVNLTAGKHTLAITQGAYGSNGSITISSLSLIISQLQVLLWPRWATINSCNTHQYCRFTVHAA